MFKDRTTATVIILAVIALVIMVVALFASSQNDAAIAQQTADAQTALAPTNDALTQAAADRQATQSILNVTATQVATEACDRRRAGDQRRRLGRADDRQRTPVPRHHRRDGPKPTATDTVTVNYRGILLDGTEFDSSYKRKQPATFAAQSGDLRLDGRLAVDAGRLDLRLHHPAGIWLRRERRRQRCIPPNATLIFQVELLSIG